jgi:catechol 2,3-dioxygenase-like lactoylglutathione lyase family enzyme
MRFHHTGLSVPDLDRSTTWYRDVLGFEEGYVFELPSIGLRGRFMVSADGIGVELLERTGATAGPDRTEPEVALLWHGFGHIALQVDGLEATYKRLVSAGARPVWDPRPSPEPGVRMAFVADFDGNLIELIERISP